MRLRVAIALFAVAVLGVSLAGQKGKHLNPMIDLLEAGKPIFGVAIPTSPGGGGGGNRGGGRAGAPGGQGAAGATAAGTTPTPAAPATPPAPPKTPVELAKDAIAYRNADYFFTGSMERAIDTPGRNGGPSPLAALTEFQEALLSLGPVDQKPYPHMLVPINSKTINISNAENPADPAKYIPNIGKQLNAGIMTISFVEVDSAEELRQGIAAMRFKSKGGQRAEDVGNAPKYWGLSEKDYRKKADVWHMSPDGELVVWAIVETPEGLKNVREIAQVPGLGVLVPGAGTLGGVFRTTNPDGTRGGRDDVAWEAAIQKVLAACKEFKKPCGYPVKEGDVETRMKQGFNVAILQSFGDAAFRTVDKGRALGGRDQQKK
jgi:2-keto-3-deoxy-L-rhamnonate aldolase RhmA